MSEDNIQSNEGKVKLKDKNLICYIQVKEKLIESRELCNLINSNKIEDIEIEPDQTGKLYIEKNKKKFIFIVFPSFEKNIKIIDSKGKQFKSTIFFTVDVKNIINYLKMKNPHYYDNTNGQYIKLTPEYYSQFVLDKKEIIKDITYSEIKYEDLKNIFEAKEIKIQKREKVFFLKDINDNIDYYLKLPEVKEENIFFTRERLYFREVIINYYNNYNTKTKKIIGVYGNYSSGKSISLLLYNYSFQFPTLYLNLKVLKNCFLTNGYTTILPNEAMNIFIKNKKNFDDYKKFLEIIYKNEYNSFDYFIIDIISFFNEWDAMIFLDQYNPELFHNEFIEELKQILNSEKSKLKVLLINSINDKCIRNIYIKSILNYFDKIDTDEEINFIFITKLIKKDSLSSQPIDEKFSSYLELFDYLPLYYSYMINNKDNIDDFISNTKNRIKEKIKKFFMVNGYEDILIQINEIRIKIDEEIDKQFFEDYNHLIPFKYFYIETKYINDGPKAFLRCHFPLIKEVWNEIIYTQTLKLFDGEINYTGNDIGSLLELNFVNQCKKGNFKLDIDCFVEIDTLLNMEVITNKNTNNFANKNILIIQKNENSSKFDIGFLKAKNAQYPSMSYIQIKKSSTDNKVDKIDTNNTFKRNKNKFFQLFKIKPQSCYLTYITLINKFLKEKIILFNDLKQNKDDKKQLDDRTIDMIKRINSLDKFCRERNIMLYYFNPTESKFYTRKDIVFTESNLNLFENISQITEDMKIKAEFLNKKKERQLEENENLSMKYNQYFLSDNSKKSHFLLVDKNKNFDFSIVYKFIKENFDEGRIKTFVFLNKENESTMNYYKNDKIIILCLCKDEENDYIIKSVIYKNYIFQYVNVKNKILIDSFEIDVKNYDLLVWVQFNKFKARGKIYEYQ